MSTGTGLGKQKHHLKPGASEVQEKGYGKMLSREGSWASRVSRIGAGAVSGAHGGTKTKVSGSSGYRTDSN